MSPHWQTSAAARLGRTSPALGPWGVATPGCSQADPLSHTLSVSTLEPGRGDTRPMLKSNNLQSPPGHAALTFIWEERGDVEIKLGRKNEVKWTLREYIWNLWTLLTSLFLDQNSLIQKHESKWVQIAALNANPSAATGGRCFRRQGRHKSTARPEEDLPPPLGSLSFLGPPQLCLLLLQRWRKTEGGWRGDWQLQFRLENKSWVSRQRPLLDIWCLETSSFSKREKKWNLRRSPL